MKKTGNNASKNTKLLMPKFNEMSSSELEKYICDEYHEANEILKGRHVLKAGSKERSVGITELETIAIIILSLAVVVIETIKNWRIMLALLCLVGILLLGALISKVILHFTNNGPDLGIDALEYYLHYD